MINKSIVSRLLYADIKRSSRFFRFAGVMVLFLSGFFLACDNNRVYEENINIPDNTWHRDNILSFNVSIQDTVSLHNLYINLRNTGKYPRSNLFLFIHTVSPLGSSVRDTFEIKLANQQGRWYGRGFGDVWSHQLLYRKNVKFPYSGIYRIEIEQAMRKKELPGIIDVGIRLEKIND